MMMIITPSAFAGYFLVLLFLGLSLDKAKALPCGTLFTTACVGERDIRYDPDATNNLVDQAAIWGKQSGLFVGGGLFRINGLEPVVGNIPTEPDPTAFIVSVPYFEFVNRTTIGTRRYSYSFLVSPFYPGPQKVLLTDGFGTSSYEKDGSLIQFESDTDTDADTAQTTDGVPSGFRARAIDDNTVYRSAKVSGTVAGIISTVRVCLDDACDHYEGSSNLYAIVGGETRRVFADDWSFTRVRSPEEWYQAIYDRYNESNIALEQRLDPTFDLCETGFCPTEEEWCRTDPNCSETPYQEPPASVRGSVVAGFVVAGLIVLVALLYLLHRFFFARQAQRYRTAFAKRIADTIEVRGSMRALPPDALVEEFNRIDAGVQDGKLSKEELWEFISSGKVGDITRRDFDALFLAIDVDGSGSVDFLEFCAFIGNCHDEYRTARLDRGGVVARSSRRLSLADTTARRLSEQTSTAFTMKGIPEEEEELTGEQENLPYRRQSTGLPSMQLSRSQILAGENVIIAAPFAETGSDDAKEEDS